MPDRRALTVKITIAAYDAIRKLAYDHGVTVTSLIEVCCLGLASDEKCTRDEVIARARVIDAERRQRRN